MDLIKAMWRRTFSTMIVVKRSIALYFVTLAQHDDYNNNDNYDI